MPLIVQFDHIPLQWCQRFSFNVYDSHIPFASMYDSWLIYYLYLYRSSGKRFIFGLGDFVQYRSEFIGRIEGIFEYEILKRDRRLFIPVSPLNTSIIEYDLVLNIPLQKLDSTQITIGLPGTGHLP